MVKKLSIIFEARYKTRNRREKSSPCLWWVSRKTFSTERGMHTVFWQILKHSRTKQNKTDSLGNSDHKSPLSELRARILPTWEPQ